LFRSFIIDRGKIQRTRRVRRATLLKWAELIQSDCLGSFSGASNRVAPRGAGAQKQPDSRETPGSQSHFRIPQRATDCNQNHALEARSSSPVPQQLAFLFAKLFLRAMPKKKRKTDVREMFDSFLRFQSNLQRTGARRWHSFGSCILFSVKR
jgi:hypothetical protein